MKKTVIQSYTEADISKQDDFTLISGIGASVEDRLHKSGIFTYRQLAELSPQEVSELLKGLIGFTPGRITKQDWAGQAQKYANQLKSFEPEDELSEVQAQQHYEVFTLELLLGEENGVRRSRAVHVQSQNEETWAGWDGERLQSFIVQEASLSLQANGEEVVGIEQDITSETILSPQPVVENEIMVPPPEISGQLHVVRLEPQVFGAGTASRKIPANKPFNIRLALDLSEVNVPSGIFIKYSAAIFAKALATGNRQAIGSSHGILSPVKDVIVDVGVNSLLTGTYRIDALITLSLPDQEPQPGSSPMAMAEGGMFQVY